MLHNRISQYISRCEGSCAGAATTVPAGFILVQAASLPTSVQRSLAAHEHLYRQAFDEARAASITAFARWMTS
jgi:hypothetical protein